MLSKSESLLFQQLRLPREQANLKVIAYLIEQNQDEKTPEELRYSWTSLDSQQNTFLHYAAKNGQKDLLEKLIILARKEIREKKPNLSPHEKQQELLQFINQKN